MMGQLPAAQNSLFYDFCLERHIPEDHLLRRIDQFLDFDQIRDYLKSFYSMTGRPSIDPELMIRMLLVGYCYGIRSERQLCDEVNFNLAYRWFCRLGLEHEVPDHSTFSKNRHGRYRDSDLFRRVFETIVQRCMDQGLVKGESFAIDGSLVRADVAKKRTEDGPVNWAPSRIKSRAVTEYLDTLDAQPALRRPQKKVSLTDPMAQWKGGKGPAEFYYSTNYLLDIEHGVIMDVEASPSTNALEVATTRTMIERVEANYHITPRRLMGDTAYGAAENLAYVVEEKQIEPHIPVWDKSEGKAGLYGRTDFTWDEEHDRYCCPAGNYLIRNRRNFTKPRSDITKANTIIYRAGEPECRICEYKAQCCPNTPARKIVCSIHEKARNVARAITRSEIYTHQTFYQRKGVEMAFAHMKRNLKLTRLRLRGLNGASDEFLLVATAQNLRKLARHCSQPPPDLRDRCA